MSSPHRQPAARSAYLVALLAVALAALVRAALAGVMGDIAPFIPFVVAVMVTAWYGGARPGLLATGLGGLVSCYLFLTPHYSLRVGMAGAAALAMFLVAGAAISWFSESLHTARRDADEKKRRAQSVSEFLLELDRSLRELDDPFDIERETTRRVGQHLGVSRCFMSQIDFGAQTARVDRAWESVAAPGAPGSYRLHDFITQDLIAAFVLGETCVVNDVRSDPRTDGPQFTAVGFRAFISAPCSYRGELLALLNVSQGAPRAWRDDEVAAVRESAARVGPMIEHARAAQALRASEALAYEHSRELQIVTDAMSTPVTRCSRDFRYLWVSRRYADWIGLPEEHIAGRSIAQVVGPEAFEQLRPYFDRVLAGERVEYEEVVTFPNLGARWIHAIYTPTHDAAGAVDGWVGVVIDVHERHKFEEALRHADRRKDEFLATLAHELRNPLAPIRNAVQILQAIGSTDPRAEWSRDVIDRQLQQLTRLVDDLLDVSRISQRKLELRREISDLRTIVDSALETSKPHIDDGRHQLQVALPEGPIRLDVDPLRIAQVLSNLLNNAAKYTPPGGHIRLSAARRGGFVEISVVDDGIGIDPALRPHLFEMFSQAVPVSGGSGGGLGIGLSLIKGLVEMHGGSIEARSAGPGSGSEFVVRLPAAAGVEAEPVEPAPAPGASGLEGGTRRRVLVVDDNRDSADSLAMLLRLQGHDVQVAYAGLDALDVAAAHRPGLVLLDIGMPGIDGYEVCRRLREEEWGRSMVIVALTGWGQEEDRRRTAMAGFDRHLVKPVTPAMLETLVSSPVAARSADTGSAS